jgi:hypothetical protein
LHDVEPIHSDGDASIPAKFKPETVRKPPPDAGAFAPGRPRSAVTTGASYVTAVVSVPTWLPTVTIRTRSVRAPTGDRHVSDVPLT